MRRPGLFVWVVLAMATAAGCGDDDDNGGGDGGSDAGNLNRVIGRTTIDLELTEKGTRAKETPIGNLFVDAQHEAVAPLGAEISFVNGGSLRCPGEFDAVQCEGYKLPAGDLTQGQLEIVAKFDNDIIIKDVPGSVIKSTLERSVSSIPTEKKGWFLHPAGLTYSADCARTAQQLSTDRMSIITEGDRVTDIKVGGQPLVLTRTYKVAVASFIGTGQDGHLLLGMVAGGTQTGKLTRQTMLDYLSRHSPVTPRVEGRITLTAACNVP